MCDQTSLQMQGDHAQLTLHVFDIELLLDLLRNPAYKAQQVFEKLVAGNMVTGVQVTTNTVMLEWYQLLSITYLNRDAWQCRDELYQSSDSCSVICACSLICICI